MPGVTVDGNDLYAVHAAAAEAVERARSGSGPTLLEAKTTRWTRHSAVSAGGSGADAEKWRTVDPIPRYRAALVEQRILSDADATQIEDQARAVIDTAVQFAIDSPVPSPKSIYEDIFA